MPDGSPAVEVPINLVLGDVLVKGYIDRVMVDDATADATVSAGWALYQWIASNSWRKIAEQESIDVSISAATNLSFTAAPTQGTVVSDTGNDATLPAVDGTNAGLMLPAHKVSNLPSLNR